jgi:hypothetical protein
MCRIEPLMPKAHSVLSSLWREAGLTTSFTVRGLNTGNGKRLPVLKIVHTSSVGHSAFCSVVSGFFPWGKATGI